jgi:formylglycine-generating enzyme required for sulfatase activity
MKFYLKTVVFIAVAMPLLFLTACGGDGKKQAEPQVSVPTVSPAAPPPVVAGEAVTLTVTADSDFTVSTSPTAGITCTPTSGTPTTTSVTCTPTVAGGYTVAITPVKDTTKAKSVTITATPLISVSVSTDAINGIPGQPVTFTVATEGTDFAIDAPEGIDCEKDGNKVTCTPSTAAEYVVTVTATADETKKQEVTITGTGAAMVLLTVGTDGGTTFSMGCSTDQYSYCPRSSRPPHDVTLTKDFYIGKYEVTQAEWKAVMGAENNPSEFKGDNLPVTNISWDDITSEDGFIAKLNVQTGRTYRLPTEAEWEYAVRGGHPEYEFSGAHFDIEDAWYNGNLPEGTTPQPQPVGGKLPNDFGLYDMSGNVREWVQDNYLSSYNSFTDPQIDPTGPEPTEQGYKVVRDGSWYDLMANSLVVGRGGTLPGNYFNYLGFRLALTIPDPATPTAKPTFFESASGTVSGVWDSAISGVKSLWNSITK